MIKKLSDWRKDYQRKLVSAEEAASLVKSGDRVVFPIGREAFACGLALAARKEELKGVEVLVSTAGYDFGWYDHGWQDSFLVEVGYVTSIVEEAVDAKRVQVRVNALLTDPSAGEDRPPDVVFVEVSPPDEHGFCSFGASLWDKKRRIDQAKIAVAEVNQNLIRTFGDNFVHVSQLDYFVEHISSGGRPAAGSLAGRERAKPQPHIKPIAENINHVIRDGDTLQIGVGRINELLVDSGVFVGKKHLGYHSEATIPGIVRLVREGVIDGALKTINPGRVVVTSVGGSEHEDMMWVDNNPLFWLMDVNYVQDPKICAAHDNFVSINQALAMDLSGQYTAQTVAGRRVAGAGGQIPFVFGAFLSKGGRAITVLPSTAGDGSVSRIVPQLPAGTTVTMQPGLVDHVVTEFGVARIRGKTLRQRAEALIAIAHPAFREELSSEAKKLC